MHCLLLKNPDWVHCTKLELEKVATTATERIFRNKKPEALF
jgi:hypothetical protein